MKFNLNLNAGDDVIVNESWQGTIVTTDVDNNNTIYAVVRDQEDNVFSVSLSDISFEDGSSVILVAERNND